MTWPPRQGPCASDCTCRQTPQAPYTPVRRSTPTCACCEPPEVTRRWLDRVDPAPAEAPPEPAINRILNATRRNT